MPLGVFDIALAALAALLGGLAGRQFALRRRYSLVLGAALGAIAGLAITLLLGGYFGSVFVALVVLGAVIVF
jgi:O-antigen ligase